MREPAQVYTRIAPNETSTFSLKCSESCDGGCGTTPFIGGSVEIRVACAHAGAAVRSNMIPATAGTTHNLASRPALIGASQYGAGRLVARAARPFRGGSRAVAWSYARRGPPDRDGRGHRDRARARGCGTG